MRYLILFIASFLFASTNIIIQYPNLKKDYYYNQIINLQIKIITPKEMNLSFIPDSTTELNITKNNGLIYLLNLKFKNNNSEKSLFIIGKKYYRQIILNKLYKTKHLEKIKGFCNILADSLKVTNIIASKLNSKYNMISFTLEGVNANLNDFTLHLKDENLTIDKSKNKATYIGTIDKNIKKIKFYYFNTKNDNFEKIEIPINIKEQTISTQTNLNPEENTLFTPVNLLLLVLTAFTIIIFLVYQRIWLLILPALLTAFLIYLNMTKGEGFLERGTKIYILPTKNSTVFYTAPIGIKVKILKTKSNYTKIEINGKIGWVKNEDIK